MPPLALPGTAVPAWGALIAASCNLASQALGPSVVAHQVVRAAPPCSSEAESAAIERAEEEARRLDFLSVNLAAGAIPGWISLILAVGRACARAIRREAAGEGRDGELAEGDLRAARRRAREIR